MSNVKIFVLKHWKLLIKLSVACLLIFLIITGGSEQFKNIDYYEVFETIRSLTFSQAIWLIFFGFLATASMTLYDYTIIRHFKLNMRPMLFFNIAFVANSLNNLLGLGGLAGAAARTILLRKNKLDLNVSIYYNVLLTPAAPTGLSLLSLWVLFFQPGIVSGILAQYPWLYLGIGGVFLLLPAFFFLGRIIDKFQKKDDGMVIHRSVSLKVRLVAISLLEWMVAFLFFRQITVIYGFHTDFAVILGIYAIAAIAGIMSFLPGGIGSFDLIALIGLQLAGMAVSDALAVLIVFRIFFFFVPSFVGVFFLILNLTMERNEKLVSYSFITNFGFFNNMLKYYKTYSDFVNVLLSVFVFSGGLVLLASAIKPGIERRVEMISEYLPLLLINFFQFTSIAIGFLLCVLSVEILYKVKRSYTLSVWLLITGGIFTFLKGMDFEEGLFLFAVLILIRFSKPSFYRHSIPVRLSKVVFLSAVGFVGIMVYYVISERIYLEFIAHSFYQANQVGIHGHVLYHSIITYGIFCLFLFVLYFKKRRIEDDTRFETPDFEKLTNFLKEQKGGVFAHLLFLGDKNFFWAAEGKILIPYAKYKNLIVVLGDPIGSMDYLSAAIQEFQDFLDKYGYEAVFYEVSDRFLSTYHENGYYFFKLGEEAVVDLESFSTAGASKSNLRHTVNSFRKKGYSFEILDPPYDEAFFSECREISREWLGKRREMGFSLGWHNEAYLQRSQIATLRSPEGKLMAFVSLMPGYDGKQSVSTDLMRIRNEVPHGTMDFIFLSLILYLKENHYKYFNLGMAPLSNVGLAPRSHFKEKIARVAFSYGKFFYSFEGLRKYKEKFDPSWKPRYLAYPQLLSLPATIMEISMLISSNKNLYH